MRERARWHSTDAGFAGLVGRGGTDCRHAWRRVSAAGWGLRGAVGEGSLVVIANYSDFIAGKSQFRGDSGFDPLWMPDFLFGFQAQLVEWGLRRGRSAILADCGLGKTPMQLVWA